MGQVKELSDIVLFLTDVTVLILKEVREHQGKSKDVILEILKALIEEKIRGEAIEAFKGLQNLPQEVKDASIDGWLTFAIETLGDIIPKLVDAITGDIHTIS